MSLFTHMEPIHNIFLLAQRWRAVEECAGDDISFFLRWTWVGSWLAALQAAGLPLPQLLVICDEAGADSALALIGAGKAQRKLGHVPALWLNQCGDARGDRPYMEYNGLLARAGAEKAAVQAFAKAMAQRSDWRVLYIAGLDDDGAHDKAGSSLLSVPGVRRRRLADRSPAHYVDLGAVRGADGDYLSLLSANSRSQIKRSLKEQPVPPFVTPVTGESALLAALADMARFNIGRHPDEAWEGAFFRDFAQRLVLAGAEDGSVQIMRVTVGDQPLGYLLNFLWAGRVMNYQSAFAAPRHKHSKPGLMTHMAAIEYYAGQGWARYSFLAGKDRYKQSLATHADHLAWWVLERWDWRLEAEAFLRRLLRR